MNFSVQRVLFGTRKMVQDKLTRTIKRHEQVKAMGLKRAPKTQPKDRPVMVEMEFLLPDEERDFNLARLPACPKCFNRVVMMRKRLDWDNGKKPKYSLVCSRGACAFSTDDVDSTQMAIQNWKVLAALMK